MKLVKLKQNDTYYIINDIDYDSEKHIDRTNSILYWEHNKHLADYCYIRSRIADIVALDGFTNLYNEEKEVCLRYTNSAASIDLIVYLMSKGLSMEEAKFIYLQNRALDIRNAADCFSNRINNPGFTVVVIKYFSAIAVNGDGQVNGEIFLDNCRSFLSDLKESAILGTNYGNNRDGFFDYIEDTGSYVGTGLSTFFTLPEQQQYLTAMIKEIKDIIYYGYTT